jgi:phosphoenolpyruvate-protein phosphotransferase (PTS system enzyme I)
MAESETLHGERGRETTLEGEVILDGVAASPGYAIGPAYVYSRDMHDVEHRIIDESDLNDEAERFEHAVSRAERDLAKIAAIAQDKLGSESAAIFEAQALMLRDNELYHAVLAQIRHEHMNADYAVAEVISRHRQLMKASESEYLRERANDLLDLQDRLVRHLRREKLLSDIERDSVVIADNITAADIVLFTRREILGCATVYGGSTSHVSIMARALNVPSLVSIANLLENVSNGDIVIVDGVDGRVVIRPTAETLENYRLRQERYRRLRDEEKLLADLPAVTLDGESVELLANVEFREELKLLKEHGASGIGLFRTEILAMMQRRMMTVGEDEQYTIYRDVVRAAAPGPVVLRVLDLGGDKLLPMGHREANPFLGWRGIRVLLDKPDILLPQVRAILRAAAHGDARILLPMITNLEEIDAFRTLLAEAVAELDARGETFRRDIPIGIMVEVPAVAIMADDFAREVDFFSIGTNDLTQYVLAIDRGNDLVSNRFHEMHPAVVGLIKHTIDAARRADIPVSVCGEVAGKAWAVPLLYGIGLRSFSASPVYLPEVKRVIRAIRTDDTESMAKEALEKSSYAELKDVLDEFHRRSLCRGEQPLDGQTAGSDLESA